ncbi:MAG: hypothetical protein ABIT07_05160, partial [Ferruginibacter sp.]
MSPAISNTQISATNFVPGNVGHFCTKKALLSFFWSVVFVTSSFAQQDTIAVISTPYLVKGLSQQKINKRIKIVAATNIVAYSAAMVGLYATWYKDYPQSKFHFFNDIKEWKQIDKIGHAYSAYAESKASM